MTPIYNFSHCHVAPDQPAAPMLLAPDTSPTQATTIENY